ncbi:unnamed protein product [Candidula unifasciata]|uniref:LanC-like protein 3 n=1 Tax=Candidula unifasciata TaxID=100452 RepID=A0A8S3Z9X2_9EUPU|nr:unnamed protein product [Candidula unifasciata]
MPRKRFFVNKMADYTAGEEIDINKSTWHEQIIALIKVITEAAQTASSDGGLYVGTAGIAYMLCYASSFEPFYENKREYLQMAKALFDRDLKILEKSRSSKADEVSFILGPSGLYALGAILGSALKNEALVNENVQRFRSVAKECLKPRFLSCGSDELFVGRAGYVCGALTLKNKLSVKVVDDAVINDICATMVQSGKDYVRKHRTKAPLMYSYYDTEYLGAAHGISSILQMIISCPSFLESNPSAAREVKAAVDWLLTIQQANGNFPPAMDEVNSPRSDSDELVHWCHGAPGVVYLFAKAYRVWGDERYLQACIQFSELTWKRGLLTKGPGICHGVAGNGYVFLLLYRLTGNKKYLHRANQFANFILTQEFQTGARTPDNPYSLYEGLAGTVCFLMDLLQPEKAAFPFFDVF